MQQVSLRIHYDCSMEKLQCTTITLHYVTLPFFDSYRMFIVNLSCVNITYVGSYSLGMKPDVLV